MAYATSAELAVWMGYEDGFTAAQEDRADQRLDVATSVIDDELGQSLVQAAETVTLPGSGTTRLVVPRWPVIAVAQVLVDEQLLVVDEDYRWERDGIVTRTCHRRWCGRVTVTYTAGWAPIPESVKGLCMELAAGSWNTTGGKKSERIADYQVAWAREGLALSTADKRSLGRYAANR